MMFKVLVIVLCLHGSNPFPARLLKMPKIYNALITTKEKLLPSEAYPATTGPVFQPIGLSGEPILLNPEAFARKAQPSPDEEEEDEREDEREDDVPNQPRPFSKGKNVKEPVPVVFYPRYSVYYPHQQPLFPFAGAYQQPILYAPVGDNQNSNLGVGQEQSSENEEPVEFRGESPQFSNSEVENSQPAETPVETPEVPVVSTLGSVNYVKNNRPNALGIPDVPPPPPPAGVSRAARENLDDKESS